MKRQTLAMWAILLLVVGIPMGWFLHGDNDWHEFGHELIGAGVAFSILVWIGIRD